MYLPEDGRAACVHAIGEYWARVYDAAPPNVWCAGHLNNGVCMFLDFSQVDPRQAYSWLASAVIPRPVAWVSTVSAAGVSNLAPFSFFQMITGKPPTVMISPLVQRDGGIKDTVRNAQETGQLVVNLVGFDMADAMNETSYSYDADVSEFERCGIAAVPRRWCGRRASPPHRSASNANWSAAYPTRPMRRPVTSCWAACWPHISTRASSTRSSCPTQSNSICWRAWAATGTAAPAATSTLNCRARAVGRNDGKQEKNAADS
jgi:flavin reductase (DIM6/NTAB) family NADH-FMN oxidoreductase RutF